MLEKQSSCQN